MLLVLGRGVAAGAAPSPAAPDGHAAEWQLGLADSGKTIHVDRGAHIVVRLPGGASGGFHRPQSSSDDQVRRTAARGGYPSQHRAVAHFIAAGPGRATLTASDDYTCLHTTPRCLPPQRQWVVHVKVRAAAAAAVRPGQSFVGVVNGTSQSPTVTVVCPGPAAGDDRRGAPTSSQTLAVAPSPALSGPGFTGSAAHRIVAVFADDPSSRVTFHSYNHPKAIPTALRLPCVGNGIVRFVPRPASSSSQPDRVRVQFVNIAD